MNIWCAFALCASAFVLSACGITVPVAVIASDGETMRGHATASALGGSSFEVSSERATCTGTFDGVTPSRTVSFVARYSDGRTGIGNGWRDTPEFGSGTIAFADGTTARFMFGSSAAGF